MTGAQGNQHKTHNITRRYELDIGPGTVHREPNRVLLDIGAVRVKALIRRKSHYVNVLRVPVC